MRLLFIIVIFACLQACNVPLANGQIPVTTELKQFDKQERQVYVVTIPMVDLDRTSRCWEEYLEENSIGWESLKHGIHRQTGILEMSISPDRFAVYNEMVMTYSGVKLTIWFEQGRKPLVAKTENDPMDVALKNYIHAFAIDNYSKEIQSRLKQEQRAKQKLEVKLVFLNRNQQKGASDFTDESYRTQSEAINTAIRTQNRKMQQLLDMLQIIRQNDSNQ